MLESNERSDCKAAGFGKHIVGIALTKMFPVIPISAELCWLYLAVFELMARSRTGEIVWSQSLCLKKSTSINSWDNVGERSTKPCKQISTSSSIVCVILSEEKFGFALLVVGLCIESLDVFGFQQRIPIWPRNLSDSSYLSLYDFDKFDLKLSIFHCWSTGSLAGLHFQTSWESGGLCF